MRIGPEVKRKFFYERAQNQEREIRIQVQERIARAETSHAEEDQRGETMPEEMRWRETRLKGIGKAKQELEGGGKR